MLGLFDGRQRASLAVAAFILVVFLALGFLEGRWFYSLAVAALWFTVRPFWLTGSR